MGSIPRNIVTNVVAGAWVVVLTLVVVPLQMRVLGAEAYGIIGLLATLQVVFSLLNLGLGPTLLRRVATDTPDRRATMELASTASAVFGLLALSASVALAWLAPWISLHWLKLEAMPSATAATAIRMIVVSLALRCPSALYGAVLSGINRLDLLNLLRAGAETLRLLGGLVVLFAWRALLPLLWWEIGVAVVELAGYALACRSFIPGLSLRPRVSLRALRENGRYALGMCSISAIAFLLTQADKLAMSKMLPLSALGQYQLAYRYTAWIAMIQVAFNSALLPSLAADHASGEHDRLAMRNSKATQLTVFAVTLPVAVMAFFGVRVFELIHAPVPELTGRVAGLLGIGFLLNAASSSSLSVVAASGRPGMPLAVILVGLAIYLPSLALLLARQGIAGAAWAWIVLNAYYVVVLVPLVQRRVLGSGLTTLLRRDVLPFAALGAATFGTAWLVATRGSAATAWVALVAAGAVYAIAGFRLLLPDLRDQILRMAGSILGAQPRTAA